VSTFSDDDEFSFSFSFLCSCVAVIRARTLFSVVSQSNCVFINRREREENIIIIITINKII